MAEKRKEIVRVMNEIMGGGKRWKVKKGGMCDRSRYIRHEMI